MMSYLFERLQQGMNVLHCAAYNNHAEVARFLYETLDTLPVNSADRDERTPLHVAAEKNNLDILERLLDYKAEVNRKDKVRKNMMTSQIFGGGMHLGFCCRMVELLYTWQR